MNQCPRSFPPKTVAAVDTYEAVMPCREETLLRDLRAPSLTWQSTRVQAHRSWPTRGGSDPRCPDLDPLSDRTYSQATLDAKKGLLQRHLGIDWHTVESETLSTRTEQYAVFFKKTVVRSYAHQLGQVLDRRKYEIEFVSIGNQSQKFLLNETTSPDLESIFEEISSRAT